MADVGDTTGASARASIPDNSTPDILDRTDPVILLIEAWDRQIVAWRGLPPDNDDVLDAAAEMSWRETGALLRRFHPTTTNGALRALRHALKCLHRYHPEACEDFYVPLAENAVATLEASAAA